MSENGVRDDVLNAGLELAMEFGQDWLKPVQGRLSQRFPSLSATELDHYDEQCRAAMTFGHSTATAVLGEFGGMAERAQARFTARLLAKYSWVSKENAGALFSQGCYYALK